MKRPLRRLVLTALAVAVGFAVTLPSAAPARAAAPVRVMQFNICGAQCNDGVVAKPGGGHDVVDDVVARIAGFRPAIVTLNEVCAVLFDKGHFMGPSGGPVGSKFSDHDALLGQAIRR
jgi:hypothetical protein